jgi:molybdenum cofactor guanylyltransferase
MMQPAPVTTVILAGGQGSRIGGDKALQNLRGRPLIDWVFAAISPQSAEVLISANENPAAFAHLGCAVIADSLPGYAGPLAGLQAAMQHASREWIASVPCDTPFLPHDLIARLFATIDDADAAVAVVEDRRQSTIALYRKTVLPKLNAYLDKGERKVGSWLDTLQVSEVVFDDPHAFINVNSRDELRECNSHD